jgi:hypothetical protein
VQIREVFKDQVFTRAMWCFLLNVTMNHDVGYDHQARLKPEFLLNLARMYPRIQLSSILPCPPTPREHLYLIKSDLQSLSPYADGKADWLIRVVRLIFEPPGSGTLFTYREGDLVCWYQREMTGGC